MKIAISTAASLLLLTALVRGQALAPRITQAVDESQLVRLAGNTHPLALADYDQGAAPPSLPLQRMLLVLRRAPAQEAALLQLLDQQQAPGSPQYHHWLTPQEFNLHFGPAAADVARVAAWLTSHGFLVGALAQGGGVLEFSGTAGQVASALHTEIHRYVVNGVSHWANASDPEIPAALAPVVAGVAALNDFESAPGMVSGLSYNSGQDQHALAPGDLAVQYNAAPLYAAATPITGAGVGIAVVGRSNINPQDPAAYRSLFLPQDASNPPTIVVNGADPGELNNSDETESDADVELAGSLAYGAAVQFVTSKTTATTDGIALSAEYIVDNNLAPVLTMSYLNCEAHLGASGNLFWSQLWQQAAAEGITALVCADDSGAAGCDNDSSATASAGLAVNGLASSPYDVAVGGTALAEGSGVYWGSANNADLSSLQQYVPETTWSEPCAATPCPASVGLWSGGGGASTVYAKPSWQTAQGVPSDGARDLPDVSLAAAGHDAFVICDTPVEACAASGNRLTAYTYFYGTSAATPAWASLMALIVQATGERQGQADFALYRLAASADWSACNASAAPAPNCLFHDITAGTNAVPCVGGSAHCSSDQSGINGVTSAFNAGVGYDQASGLGTPNAANLVAAWSGVTSTPAAIAASAGAGQSAPAGQAFATAFAATVSDVQDRPESGVSVTFTAPATGASGTFSGSGTIATATTNAQGLATAPVFTANTAAGSYTVVASVAGLSTTAAFALANTGTAASIAATGGGQTTTVLAAFAASLAVNLKDSGGNPMPGVTVVFTAPASGASGTFADGATSTSIVTDANGNATAAFTANAVAGSYTASAAVTGTSLTASFALRNLAGPPATVVAASGGGQTAAVGAVFTQILQAQVRDTQGNAEGAGIAVTFTAPATGASGGFSGSPSTMASTDATGTAAAPVFTANATPGGYAVTALVAGVSQAANFALTNAGFTFAASPSAATTTPGLSPSFNLILSSVGGFSGAVGLSCAVQPNLPCNLSSTSVALSAGGTAAATLIVTVPVGSASLPPFPSWPRDVLAIIALLLTAVPRRRRCTVPALVLYGLLAAGCGGGSGGSTGGSGSTGATAPSIYAVTVTATSGAETQIANLTLTVN